MSSGEKQASTPTPPPSRKGSNGSQPPEQQQSPSAESSQYPDVRSTRSDSVVTNITDFPTRRESTNVGTAQPVHLTCDTGTTDIVEARVMITSSKLNEILGLLVAQSNRHEDMLTALQNGFATETKRVDTLAKNLDDLKPDGDRQKELERRVDSVQSQVKALKEDSENRFERVKESHKQKSESFEKQIKEINDWLAKDLLYAKEMAIQAEKVSKENKERLDLQIIPDIKPLENASKQLDKRCDAIAAELDVSTQFTKLWHADYDECKRLNTVRGSTETPLFNETAKADYLDKLLVFQMQKEAREEVQRQCKQHTDGVNIALSGKLHEKVNHAEIAEVANAVSEAKNELKKSVDYVDRRLHDIESITEDINSLQERCERLRLTKADAGLLELKGDADVLSNVNYRVSTLREDMNIILDKLNGMEQSTRHSPIRGGELRRQSSIVNMSGSTADNMDMRRRFADLEAADQALDMKKAEKADLIRLQEYVDSMFDGTGSGFRSKAGSVGGKSGPGAPRPGSGYSSQTSVQQFSLGAKMSSSTVGGHSNDSTPAIDAAENNASFGADALTPHKPGSSSGGGGGSGGTGTGGPGTVRSRPQTGDSSHSRLGSASNTRWRSPVGQAVGSIPHSPRDGPMLAGDPTTPPPEGHYMSAGGGQHHQYVYPMGRDRPTIDGVRMGQAIGPVNASGTNNNVPRQTLGSGVVMVRDSGGGSIPVTVGASPDWPYVADRGFQAGPPLLPPPIDSALQNADQQPGSSAIPPKPTSTSPQRGGSAATKRPLTAPAPAHTAPREAEQAAHTLPPIADQSAPTTTSSSGASSPPGGAASGTPAPV